jgi:YbbR domain-containing protein
MKQRWGIQQFIALLLSLLLWALARSNRDTVSTKALTQLTMSVAIHLENVPKSMIPYQMSQDEVRVTLQGDPTSINALRESHLKAWAEVSGSEANNSWPTVRVLAPGGLTVISQDPQQINVQMSPSKNKVVPVKVSLSGAPANGLSIDDVRMEPSHVRVWGPEALVNDVVEVSAKIVLNGQSQDYSLDLRDLVPVNAQGREVTSKITKLKCVPSSVAATVPFISDSRTAVIPVALDEVKVVAAKGWSVQLQVEPEFVTLRLGRKQKAPKSIRTKAISFKVGSKVEKHEVDLIFPDGIEAVSGSTATLTITPEKSSVKEPSNTSKPQSATTNTTHS